MIGSRIRRIHRDELTSGPPVRAGAPLPHIRSSGAQLPRPRPFCRGTAKTAKQEQNG
ncbi:hypothetical protein T261_1701 [Streptomyces lydicus]|nr:hypothetical protein T261_1701 [Streptomyces lydicus]